MDIDDQDDDANHEFTSELTTLSPRLVVEYSVPEDQVQLAWNLAVFDARESTVRQALSLTDNAVRYQPESVLVYCARALALIRLGRPAEAGSEVQRAIQLDPAAVEVRLLTAYLKYAEGNPGEAAHWLEAAKKATRGAVSSKEITYLSDELQAILKLSVN